MSAKASGTIGKAIATGGVLLTACAVCCAPLVVTPLVAFFAAGGLGLALAGQIGLGIATLGALGGYLCWRRRAASRRAGSCGCSPVGGCASADESRRAQGDREG